MKAIPVGDVMALVDVADYDPVASYRWYLKTTPSNLVYAQANVYKPNGKRTSVFMHRLIMDAPKGVQVDHRNHDGLDNRRENLRLASDSQNQGNQRLSRANTSGYKGVSWDVAAGKWKSHIHVNGKQFHLGYFTDLGEAASAYDAAATRRFGEFAFTNEMRAF